MVSGETETEGYDDLVDDILEWNDGYTLRSEGSTYRTFDASSWQDVLTGSDHVLIHLHGSVRFGYGQAGVRGEPLMQPRKYDTRDAAQASLSSMFGGERIVAGESYGSAVIISGLNKAGKLLFNARPYGHYFLTAIQALLTSERILTIGYAGRDYHLNSWIEEHAAIHGPQRRAAVILPLSGKMLGAAPAEFELIRLLCTNVPPLRQIYEGAPERPVISGSLIILPTTVPDAFSDTSALVAHLR